MHIDKFKYPISIQEAIEKIKLNSGHYFIWFPVINKKGYKFELGGTSKELRALIPEYNNKQPVVYPLNGYVKTGFYIVVGSWIHPDDGFTTSEEIFLKLIEQNLDKFKKEKEEVQVIEYETKTTFKYERTS